PAVPIVVVDADYWKRVLNFEALAEAETIGREDLALFEFANTAEEAWAVLVKRGLTAHVPPSPEG
ncbi:MAG: 3-isopropylmalate dehydrogenase, partial [Stellaceae bacterium]